MLFRLEDEDVIANFDDNEIERLTAQATIIGLEAERNDQETLVFPKYLPDDAPGLSIEIALFKSRRQAKQGELDVLQQEAESLRRAIDEKQAEADLAIRQLETIGKEREIIAPLVEKGFEPQITLLSIDSKLKLKKAERQLLNYRSSVCNLILLPKTKGTVPGKRISS